MKIAYLLEDSQLSGGTRVVLGQADALIARGHRARIITKGLPLTWRNSRAEWVYVDNFKQYDAAEDDFVVATFWTTVAPAWRLAGKRAVHLSQGYEGAFTAYQELKPQIDAVYKLPIPKLVVSQSVAPVLRQFTDDITWIGQIVDDEFYRLRIPRENEPMRILLSGPSQADMKGVHEGYGAAAHARWFHQTFDLIRVSPWAPSRDEPLDAVQEFHVALTTAEMTRLMHSCDGILAPNHRAEGFGLPAAEALASGVAAVMTSIPAYLAFGEPQDYALFAPEENAVELGEKLIELLSDFELRQRLRKRGREIAEQWHSPLVAERLERFFHDRSSRTA